MRMIYSLYIEKEELDYLAEFAFKNKIKSKNELLRSIIKDFIAAKKEDSNNSSIKWNI